MEPKQLFSEINTAVEQFNTVNVLDCRCVDPFQVDALRSFPDTPKGNKEAEKVFREWVQAANDGKVYDEDMEAYIENGIFESIVGMGFIAIIHSC